MVPMGHWIAAILGLAASSFVRAQEDEPPGADLPSLEVAVRAGDRYIFEGELDDEAAPATGDAEVAVNRASLALVFSSQLTERLSGDLTLAGELSHYDFSNASDFLPGTGDEEPFEQTESLIATVTGAWELTDTWAIFAMGRVDSSREEDADFGDSISGGGGGGFIWKFSNELTFRLAAGVFSSLEEDEPIVVPLIGVDWKVDDRLSLRTEGLGLRITRRMTDDLDLFIVGAYEIRQFRLNDEHGPLSEGAVRDDSLPVAAGLDWRPIPQLSLRLEGGAIVYQEYEVFEDDGDDVNEINTDPSPFLAIRVTWRF